MDSKALLDQIFKYSVGDVVAQKTQVAGIISRLRDKARKMAVQDLEIIERWVQQCYNDIQIFYTVRVHSYNDFQASFTEKVFRVTEDCLIPLHEAFKSIHDANNERKT